MIRDLLVKSDDTKPHYYKMMPKSGPVSDSVSKRNANKRRVEIKYKKLAYGKILVILKDLSLYSELEKNRTKNQLRSLFFASYAHELFTPINILQGMNEEALFQARISNMD